MSAHSPQSLESIITTYEDCYGFKLITVDHTGRIIYGRTYETDCLCGNRSGQRRIQAAEQTRYWGETVIHLCCDTSYPIRKG